MFAAGKSGGVTTPTDPQFNYVTMLLHGDGTNGGQNNTFLDSSTNNFSITRNGNTTQGSFSPYGSLWSNYFDGSGDYLTTSASQVIPTGSFTVECFVFVTGSGSNQKFVSQGSSGNAGRFSVGIEGGNWWVQIGGNSVQTGTPARNQWVYVAVTYNGSTLSLYADGSLVGSVSNSTSVQNTTLTIGQDWNSYTTTGYISNVRVSNTVRTVTSVPTAAFTADANTVFLSCQANRFLDASTNAYALNRNGDVRVTNFAPFNPTAAYSTATNGGSGYFDGSGDYLGLPSSTAFTFGTGDFTVEFWGYFTSTPNCHFISLNDGVGTDAPTGYYYLSYESNQFFSYGGNGGQGIFTSYTMPLNSWVHIVACRSGTTHSIFVNGTRIVTGTTSYSYTSGTNPTVGKGGPPSGSVTGYMSGVRLVKGSAVYDPSQSTLTVPTAPPTAITNTSLLLNFTNAGIFDNSMMNDLETVGNAQISTTQKKYGTASMYFDGTGDGLRGPANMPQIQLGSGDFTVECWLYQTATNTYPSVLEIGNHLGTGGILFIASDGSTITAYSQSYGGFMGTATAPSLNTWNHIAWVRYNGTFKIYVNGVGNTGVTATTNFNSSSTLTIGADQSFDSTYTYTGYIDDLRITKGVARYTANFTPPTAAFPNQ